MDTERKDINKYISELGACYLYFLCKSISKLVNSYYKINIDDENIIFSELIPDDFKNACNNVRYSNIQSCDNNIETDLNNYKILERFLNLEKNTIISQRDFSKVKQLLINDYKELIKRTFGLSFHIDISGVYESLRNYTSKISLYYLRGVYPKILNINEISINNDENNDFMNLSGYEQIDESDDNIYIKLLNMFYEEENKLNNQIQKINQSLGKTISKIIKPLFGLKTYEIGKSKGLGICSEFNDFLSYYINYASIEIYVKKLTTIKNLNSITDIEELMSNDFKNYNSLSIILNTIKKEI